MEPKKKEGTGEDTGRAKRAPQDEGAKGKAPKEVAGLAKRAPQDEGAKGKAPKEAATREREASPSDSSSYYTCLLYTSDAADE